MKPKPLSRKTTAVVGAVAAMTAVTGGLGLMSPAASAATGTGPSAPMRLGPRPALPASARAIGALAASTPMAVTVTLRPNDAAALAATAAAVSTRGNPDYHHYLTPAQFVARFAPTTAQIADVEGALRAAGLHPGPLSGNHLAITVHADAGQLSHAFATSFERYRLASGRTAYVNTASPRFTAATAGLVEGVIGLDTLTLPQRRDITTAPHAAAHAAPAATGHVATGGPQPCSAATSAGSANDSYTADQLASAYKFSSLYGAGDLGAGETVALYELEPNLTTDIAKYQSCYGTSASVTYTKVDGGSGTGAGEGEAALDIEDVIGLVPEANIIVYQGPNTDSGGYDTYNSIISADKANVVSTSWGECESEEGSSAASSENTLFEEAATQGQSIVAAAGDSGSEDCGTNSLAVDDPASQPYVTGVGGTTLSTLGPPPSQTVWNESANGSGAGGGGISTLWTMPSYQSGAPSSLNVINSGSSKTPCGASSGYCREVPDVSADADPYSGYVVYYDGSWTGIGGTSAAAPLWGAFLALTDASSTCGGTAVGFANPMLYSVAGGSGYSSDFYDVKSGNNDYTGTNNGKFTAGAGYDEASGLGSPDGAGLPAALCGGTSSGTHTITVTNPGSQTSTVGTAVSLSIKATDSASGQTLSYSATGLPAGLAISSTTGAITGKPTTASSYSTTVTVTDGSGASGKAAFTWTVQSASGGCTATQLLGNPGFETGSAAPWTSTSGVIQESSSEYELSHSGNYLAWLDGYGTPTTDTLAQTVSIPAACTTSTFSFWLHIDSSEDSSSAIDTLKVQVLNSSGTVLSTLATYSNLTTNNGYKQVSFNVSSYSGEKITVKFTGKETDTGGGTTDFCVDDTSLKD
jgi:subtilase family serine protease